jgi:hypothetical protein
MAPEPTVGRVEHRRHVEALLAEAAAEHAALAPELRALIPVDASGLTSAIDHLAAALGLTIDERRALVRPHGVNPAVMHARVFGRAPLSLETVVASFVEGARVRADALVLLADRAGAGEAVRRLLLDAGDDVPATQAAQERAALLIADAI